MKVSATAVALALASSVVAAPGTWGSEEPYSTSAYSSSYESAYATSSSYPSTTAEAAYSSETEWASWNPSYSSPAPYSSSVSYTTIVVNSLTTFCPYATTIAHG